MHKLVIHFLTHSTKCTTSFFAQYSSYMVCSILMPPKGVETYQPCTQDLHIYIYRRKTWTLDSGLGSWTVQYAS